jgi:hypothetical protein
MDCDQWCGRVVQTTAQPVEFRSPPEVANVHRLRIFSSVCLALLITFTPIRSEEKADRTAENLINVILDPTGSLEEKRQDCQALLSKSAEAVPILRARIRTELQKNLINVGPVLNLVSDLGPAASDATSEVIECIAQVDSGWGTLAAIAESDFVVWVNRLHASDHSASGELLRRIASAPATAESMLVKAFDDDQAAAGQRLVAGVALYRGGALSSDRQATLLAVYKKELANQAIREKPSTPSVEVWDLPDPFAVAQWMASHSDDWVRLQLCKSPLPRAARPIVLDMLDYRSSEAVLNAALERIDRPQNSWEIRHFTSVVFDTRLPRIIRLDALDSLCSVGQHLGEANAMRLLEAVEKPPEGLDQESFINYGIEAIHGATRMEFHSMGDFESRFLKKVFVLIDRPDIAYICGKMLLLKTSGGKELFRGWLTDGNPKVQQRILGILESEPKMASEFRREIRKLMGNQRPVDLSTALSAARVEFALTQDFEAVRSVFEAALASPDDSVRADAVVQLPTHRDSADLVAKVLSRDRAPKVRLVGIKRLATSLSSDEAGKIPPTSAVWSAVFSNTRYQNEVGEAARRYLDESQRDVLASAEGVLTDAVRHESPLVREEALKAADKLVTTKSLSLYFSILDKVKSDRPPISAWRNVLRTTLVGTANFMNSAGAQSPKSLQQRLFILSDNSYEMSQILSAIKRATTHEDEQVRRTAKELHEKLLNSLK